MTTVSPLGSLSAHDDDDDDLTREIQSAAIDLVRQTDVLRVLQSVGRDIPIDGRTTRDAAERLDQLLPRQRRG